MIKGLGDKVFKHYIYIENYNTALNFVRILRLKKTSSIIFSKKPQISKKHLVTWMTNERDRQTSETLFCIVHLHRTLPSITP